MLERCLDGSASKNHVVALIIQVFAITGVVTCLPLDPLVHWQARFDDTYQVCFS